MQQKMGEMMKCAQRKEREMNLIKDIVGRGRWFATENMAWLLSPQRRVGRSLSAELVEPVNWFILVA
jgi:hypothetical protein